MYVLRVVHLCCVFLFSALFVAGSGCSLVNVSVSCGWVGAGEIAFPFLLLSASFFFETPHHKIEKF